MHCHDVEDLLVAWHDGELAPSAAAQLEEHLAGCPHCVRRSQRLLATTPAPWASPPADVRRQLASRVNVDLVCAEAERLGPAEPAVWRPPRWWTEPREVRPPVLLAYAALLALSLGWGWMNWARLPAGIEGVAGHAPAQATDVIPAEAYAPASYEPADKEGPSDIAGPHP